MKKLVICLMIFLLASAMVKAEENFNSSDDTMIISVTAKSNPVECAQNKPGPMSITASKPNDPELMLYPNPATEKLTIKSNTVLSTGSETIRIFVIDMKGRIVLDQKDICPAGAFYQKDLNVRGLPKGEYILKLVIGKHTCTRVFEVYY